MNKFIKHIAVLFITLLMIMPSFISADDYPTPTPYTLEFPVTVEGAKGTVHMIPWSYDLKDSRYLPGPALSDPELVINAGETKNFEILFEDAGNYVYEVKQINKTESGVIYDETIYRVFITLVYEEIKDKEGKVVEVKMNPLVEAQKCVEDGCVVPPGAKDVEELTPEEIEEKPDRICFINKKTNPPYNPPKTGLTVQDVIITGGLCSEFFILLLLLFKRKKKKET